jgi:hypothetical protein
MDLGILNTVIALVIVLLVLSLLVQALQTFVKKLFKLKSRQIADSLKDLYEQAIGSAATPAPAAAAENTGAQSPAEQFRDRVLEQFKNIGRKTLFGNAVLDSLSKEDLFKVVGRLELEQFFPDYVAKFQVLCDQVIGLRQAIENLTNNATLRGAASSKLAEVRSILAPIFTNVQSILDGTQVRPRVLFADLLRLGKLNIKELLGLLDDAQRAITEEKEIATNANNKAELEQLQNLSDGLAHVAKLIGDLSQKFDDAVSPLRQKLEQVEIWFDTVTQSFDERYTRHMRTVSICISIVVVIVLNASFFRVYKSISANEVQRNLIVESGRDLLARARESELQPTPSESPSTTPSPSPVNVKEEFEKTRQQIELLTNTYQGLGFAPLSGEQVRSFLWSTGLWTRPVADDHGRRDWWGFTLAPNENGVRVWRLQTRGEWWASLKGDVVTLVGWAIMVTLLSVGAPFWQDTLESLFGVKNLLRQKSKTQNIEAQSGAGQPKE